MLKTRFGRDASETGCFEDDDHSQLEASSDEAASQHNSEGHCSKTSAGGAGLFQSHTC